MLAGGRSSRMGRDKAQLALPNGDSLLERSVALLEAAGFEACIAGLPSNSNVGPDSRLFGSATVVRDNVVDAGPLGGIEAALNSLPDSDSMALFVPVDLPLLPLRFLSLLWERAERTGALATVPYFAGSPQPLCAVYSARLAEPIRSALSRGDRKVMRVVGEAVPADRFDRFRVEALAPLATDTAFRGADPWSASNRWFTNVNTPAEWQAVHAVMRADEVKSTTTGIAHVSGEAR